MITIDIARPLLEDAIKSKIAQLDRAKTKSRTPKFAELYENDIRELRKAEASIKETK